jgi:predicted nucleic acid-binding protein
VELLDTNVISEARKPAPDPNVRAWLDSVPEEEWGRLNVPDPLPVVDGLMAATASSRNWTFVTRNVKDLARTRVRLLNPFEAP